MLYIQWIELSYTRYTIAQVKLLVEWVRVKTAVHLNIHRFNFIVYICTLYIIFLSVVRMNNNMMLTMLSWLRNTNLFVKK